MAKFNKMSKEAQRRYHQYLNHTNQILDSTIDSPHSMLKGSDDLEDSRYTPVNEEFKKKPIRYVLWDIVKKNPIITALLTTAIIAAVTFIINTNNDMNIINLKIEGLRESVSTLQSTSANKENLLLEIDLIKKDFENMFSLDLNDIQWRLSSIEDELDSITNK